MTRIDDGAVVGANTHQLLVVEVLLTAVLGGQHEVPRVTEQSGHVIGPRLPIGLGGRGQLSNVMRITELVFDAVVVAIGHPTVVDQYSAEVLENSHFVHGRGASALIEVIQRQISRGERVHPGQ